MSESDYADEQSELTATPWLAHLAAGSATASGILAWVLLALVAPSYLQPYSDQEIALSPMAQIVLGRAHALSGAIGWSVLLSGLAAAFFLWRKAVKSGGMSTMLLFGSAGLFAAVAVAVVIACASPLHLVQDLSAPK